MSLEVAVPLLSGLPKMEKAKLLVDLEEVIYEPEQPLPSSDDLTAWAYFVVEGELGVVGFSDIREVPLFTLGPGDLLIGQTLSAANGVRLARAMTRVRLYRLPIRRFQRLLNAEPKLAEEVLQSLTLRLAGHISDLARTKSMLATYVDEVWRTVPSPQPDQASASMGTAPVSESVEPPPLRTRPHRIRTPPLSEQLYRPAVLLLGPALGLLTYKLHEATHRLAAATSILVWATWNWLLGVLPDYATAVAALVIAVVAGVVSPSIAFSGFANPSWFLLLGVLGIGVAVARSGLLYRLALHMLRLFPPTYLGQSFALALTGLLFTPLLPSANSRAAMVSPLTRELSDAMRFPHFSRGSSGLAMSTFLGFGQMYFMFLNTNTAMLAWSLLPRETQHQIGWLHWFWLALPLGLVTFVGSYAAILYMFRPEPTPGVSRDTIRAQLAVLGHMSAAERATTWVLALVLVGFVTQPLHGVDPAWLAMAGMLLLIALGVMDKNDLKSMDWAFMLLVGALVSLSEVIKATGLGEQLTLWIHPMTQVLGPNPYLFLGAVAVLTVILRMAIPIQQAVMLNIIALLPLSTQLGYNPFVVALVVLTASSSWIVPQQHTVYVTVHAGMEERGFTHAQVRPLALIQSAVCVLAVLVSVPFWQFLGLLPGPR